jgi:hypothetical protein
MAAVGYSVSVGWLRAIRNQCHDSEQPESRTGSVLVQITSDDNRVVTKKVVY